MRSLDGGFRSCAICCSLLRLWRFAGRGGLVVRRRRLPRSPRRCSWSLPVCGRPTIPTWQVRAGFEARVTARLHDEDDDADSDRQRSRPRHWCGCRRRPRSCRCGSTRSPSRPMPYQMRYRARVLPHCSDDLAAEHDQQAGADEVPDQLVAGRSGGRACRRRVLQGRRSCSTRHLEAPRQIGRDAEELDVEPVAETADGLRDQQARSERVGEGPEAQSRDRGSRSGHRSRRRSASRRWRCRPPGWR